MKGLLTKDFYKTRKYIGLFLFLYVGINIGFILVRKEYTLSTYSLSSGPMLVFIMIMLENTIGVGKEEGDMAYTLSMPIDKNDYVNEKLVFSAILIVLIFLANIFVGFLLKIYKGVDLMDQEFFLENIMYAFTGLAYANFGINLSLSIGEGGFLLAIFPWLLVMITIPVFFPVEGDLLSYLASNKLRLVIWLLAFIAVNVWFRNSSIKKLEKQRF